MTKLSIRDLDLKNQYVVVRVDFNVPLDESGEEPIVADDTRITAALPTINHILTAGGFPILLSHLGRPKGEPNPKYSLKPVVRYLEKLTGKKTALVVDITSPQPTRHAFADGSEIVVIENTRFHAGETTNDSTLAKQFAELGDRFVNDAFGTAHRAHASTVGICEHVSQSAMGFLLEKEVNYLGKVLHDAEHPFVAIIGGAKVSDKIGVIESLLTKVDHLLIGGAMSYTFLKAQGIETGTSLVEDDKLDDALDLLKRSGDRISLPTDHMVARSFSNDAEHHVTKKSIDAGWMGLDIGPESIEAYKKIIMAARTVVWNGPMGVFEMPHFATGTLSVAQALAAVTRNGALTVVGGGDSVAAITQAELDDDVSHVSTGGGAMLEFLEGIELPGVAALTDKQ